MNTDQLENSYWTVCQKCLGRGKKSRRLKNKVRLQHQAACEEFEKSAENHTPPIRPKGQLYLCPNCGGSGLLKVAEKPVLDHEKYPHVAIIGGGIGGVALAVACLHRGIPFTLYERDIDFSARPQGYGLTLQQASRAIEGLGIFSYREGVVSTRHLVHNTEGEILGEWGSRKSLLATEKPCRKRSNVHIARQSLRLALIQQLGGYDAIHWGHQLIDFKKDKDDKLELNFIVDGQPQTAKADLLIGADGIRSSVRRLLLGEEIKPLHYLGCIVILGICPLSALKKPLNALLDSATVFQTANGSERIYMMPFTTDSVMWQLSFPMEEHEAMALSQRGSEALKIEAQRRLDWHEPIPEILAATSESQISGYPVYDRELLDNEIELSGQPITLIGDAAHPMSPFKGQGANQALLDALALARAIYSKCRTLSWRNDGIRAQVLTEFEQEMIGRSASKVKDSADAAQFLHSELVLQQSDQPRGTCFKEKNCSLA